MFNPRTCLPALYLNLVLVLLLVVNLAQSTTSACPLYFMTSVVFNPLGALLAVGLGKWRMAPWFGLGIILSIGVIKAATPFDTPFISD
jgi:hypothetical protein